MHVELNHFPLLMLSLLLNAVSSLFLLFALSPVLGDAHGVHHTFSLMELMNLDILASGTYDEFTRLLIIILWWFPIW